MKKSYPAGVHPQTPGLARLSLLGLRRGGLLLLELGRVQRLGVHLDLLARRGVLVEHQALDEPGEEVGVVRGGAEHGDLVRQRLLELDKVGLIDGNHAVDASHLKAWDSGTKGEKEDKKVEN